MDCPDSCALEVEVQGGRVKAIRGGHNHPNTAGFICSKVANFNRRLEHPNRLLHPMRRVGEKGEGKFARITWVDAISEITERFQEIRQEWGGEAIVPFHYGGSNGLLTDGLLDDLYFRSLGASVLELTICAVPTTAVATDMYGRMPGVAFEDFPQAKCIIIWGANPKASNIHLVPYLKQAKKNGAFIATVDPRANFSDAEVDLHLGVRPGADLPLALGMIDLWRREGLLDGEFLDQHAVGLESLLEEARRWPLERAAATAGVEAAKIELLARTYAQTDPALMRCGWGLERNRNGGQAVAAVLAMPALLGKFGKRGGGYALSNGGAKKFDRQQIFPESNGNPRRSFNMTQLGRWLNDDSLAPPVKALFVYNANPVATVPNSSAVMQGLERPDLLTVVFEQIHTDTCRFADILLPAVTFLEGWDLRAGYGSFVMGGVRPVIEPMGEARTNQRVFADLGRAMGHDDPCLEWTEEELFRRVVAAVDLSGKQANAETLIEGRNEGYDFPGPTPVQFETVHPRTSAGKVHLTPEVLGPNPYEFTDHDHEQPLSLITPASGHMISSTMGEYNCDRLVVDIHPQDAKPRSITSGDKVRVYNSQGKVECVAKVTDRVRPGVISMPKGAWQRSSLNGATSVALCPDHVNVVGGAACFNDARVEIERL